MTDSTPTRPATKSLTSISASQHQAAVAKHLDAAERQAIGALKEIWRAQGKRCMIVRLED